MHENGGPTALENIDGAAVIGVPIAAGRRRIGVMVIHGDVQPDADLLTSASLALAIAASRRDAEAAVVAERAAWLVSELRYGSTRETTLVKRSAERFGLNLDEPHAAAAFRYTGGNESSWNTAVRWIETPTERRGDTAWTVIAGEGHAELRRIQDRLGGIVGREGEVVAVCGSVVRSSAQTSRSFREAEVLVELAVVRGVDLLTPAMSGIDTLLVSLDPVLLGRFVEDALVPLLGSPQLIDSQFYADLFEWKFNRRPAGEFHEVLPGVKPNQGIHRETRPVQGPTPRVYVMVPDPPRCLARAIEMGATSLWEETYWEEFDARSTFRRRAFRRRVDRRQTARRSRAPVSLEGWRSLLIARASI